MQDTVAANPPDVITLKGIKARGFHGVMEAEKTLGQPFIADMTLFLDLSSAGTSDDIERTVNYAAVADIAADILSGTPFKLIETVALKIVNSVLDNYSLIDMVQITVHKPCAPLSTPLADVSVTITRKRARRNGAAPMDPAAPAHSGAHQDQAGRSDER